MTADGHHNGQRREDNVTRHRRAIVHEHPATLNIPVPLGENAWEFRVAANDNPAVLFDGDRYRLTITDRNGSVVAAVDKTVVYQQSYPNGTDCDPYPCRWADVGP